MQETNKFVQYLAQPHNNESGEPVEPIETKIYSTFIRKAVAMAESQTMRTDIFSYAPDSTVAEDYNAFIDEYLTSHGLEAVKNG